MSQSLPKPALALARRACQLAAMGDSLHEIQIAFIHGEWYIAVNNGKLEQLGKVDQYKKVMVR